MGRIGQLLSLIGQLSPKLDPNGKIIGTRNPGLEVGPIVPQLMTHQIGELLRL